MTLGAGMFYQSFMWSFTLDQLPSKRTCFLPLSHCQTMLPHQLDSPPYQLRYRIFSQLHPTLQAPSNCTLYALAPPASTLHLLPQSSDMGRSIPCLPSSMSYQIAVCGWLKSHLFSVTSDELLTLTLPIPHSFFHVFVPSSSEGVHLLSQIVSSPTSLSASALSN